MPYRPPPEVLERLRSDVPCPAYIGSDRRFFSGGDDGFGHDNRSRQAALAKARAAGVDVTGAKYFPSLAEETFDPKAWMRDTVDLKHRAREIGRGLESPGLHLEAPNVEVPDDKPYEVANDVVEKELDIVIDRDYGGHVTPQKQQDLFHEIKAKRSNVKF